MKKFLLSFSVSVTLGTLFPIMIFLLKIDVSSLLTHPLQTCLVPGIIFWVILIYNFSRDSLRLNPNSGFMHYISNPVVSMEDTAQENIERKAQFEKKFPTLLVLFFSGLIFVLVAILI